MRSQSRSEIGGIVEDNQISLRAKNVGVKHHILDDTGPPVFAKATKGLLRFACGGTLGPAKATFTEGLPFVASGTEAKNGGERGIRTLGEFYPPFDFESSALTRAQPSLLCWRLGAGK